MLFPLIPSGLSRAILQINHLHVTSAWEGREAPPPALPSHSSHGKTIEVIYRGFLIVYDIMIGVGSSRLKI